MTEKNKAGNVGMYLLLHANTDDTAPSASVLGQVISEFINRGAKFRKINLTGCRGAGDRYQSDAIQKSAMYRLCQQLLINVSTDMRSNMIGLMVSGYTGISCTYNPKSNYSKTAFGNDFVAESNMLNWNGEKEERPWTIFRRNEKGPYEPTHVTERYDIEAIKSDCDAEKKNGGNNPKRLKANANRLFNKHKILKSFKDYIETKVVLVYNLGINGFQQGSLAEYTDNENIKELVGITREWRVNLTGKQELKLTLTT
jgi:hypothetical protein